MEFNSSRPDSWLLFGDLLCISIDGSFQEPVWAVVENHIVQQRLVVIVCFLPSVRLLLLLFCFVCLFVFLGGGWCLKVNCKLLAVDVLNNPLARPC